MHALPTQAITSLRRPTGLAAPDVQKIAQVDGLAPSAAEAFLSQFVSARLSLAAHQLEEGDADAAAICIAETHCLLLSCLCGQNEADTWPQAALRHSRRTHCALLNHLREFGSHPAIDDSLRAGCLSLSIPSQRLH